MKNLSVMVLLFLFFPLVSSTVIIEDDFDSVYNVGDLIKVNFSVQRSIEVSDFVEVLLDCGDEEFTLKKDYILVEPDVRREFSFESPLGIEGNCRLKVVFLNEEVSSEEFEVSDNLIIDYTMNDKFFYPNETLIINGTVEKESGEDYSGVLNFIIEGLDEKSVEVISGNFNLNYVFSSNSLPKEYRLEFLVEERNFVDEVLNEGRRIDFVEIKRKATYLEIESVESFQPSYNFSFNISLLDQAREKIENKSVVVKLKNPLGDVIFQGSFSELEEIDYLFSSESMKGGWNLHAYYGNLVTVKPIYIEENMEIDTYVSGNILKFENVGNVVYDGIVEVDLGNSTFEDKLYVNVSVPVGSVYDYPLYYEGEYNLTLDGESLGLVHLTGYAIAGDIELTWRSYVLFLGVLIFLFLVWFFVFKKKVFRKFGKEIISEKKDFAKEVIIPSRKILVKEAEEEKISPVNKKTYALFFESSENVENFSGIIENYGYKMNKVDDKIAYTIFYEKEGVNSESKLYNLARAIKRFSKVRGEKVSIVINRGEFEGKLSLLKKFALLNRSLLKYAEGKILMTRKFYDLLKLTEEKKDEVVEVMDRELKVCLV
jgi:hypothetical protein